jgi:hypothetical protein
MVQSERGQEGISRLVLLSLGDGYPERSISLVAGHGARQEIRQIRVADGQGLGREWDVANLVVRGGGKYLETTCWVAKI